MIENPADKVRRLLTKATGDVNEGENALGRVLTAIKAGKTAKAATDANIAQNEMGQSLYALKQLGVSLEALIAGQIAPQPSPTTDPAPTPTPKPDPVPTIPPTKIPTEVGEVFGNIQIHGGGFLTDGMQSARGRYEMAGTDTATAFIRERGEVRWRQTLLEHTIPGIPALTEAQRLATLTDNGGTYTQAIGEDGVGYVCYRGFLIRSLDAFTSRAEVIFGPMRSNENLGQQRCWTGGMAIDPTNSRTFVIGYRGAGEYGGAWCSINGAAPQRIASISPEKKLISSRHRSVANAPPLISQPPWPALPASASPPRGRTHKPPPTSALETP